VRFFRNQRHECRSAVVSEKCCTIQSGETTVACKERGDGASLPALLFSPKSRCIEPAQDSTFYEPYRLPPSEPNSNHGTRTGL